MYGRKDPTEVPSYFLGDLISAGANALSSVGNTIASGIGGGLSNAVSHIPVVGNVLGDGLSHIGSSIGHLSNGFNVGDALGSLYTGADTLLGGVLPGGQAFSQGYLGNLYGAADKALGGYLPNIGGGAAAGGVGVTPQYMQAQRAFDALPGPASSNPNMVGTSLNGGPVTYAPINSGGKSMVGRALDGLEKVARVGQLGMGIYDATRKSPQAANARAHRQLIQTGNNPGTAQMIGDPAAAGAPEIHALPTGVITDPNINIPLTTEATGGAMVGDVSGVSSEIAELNEKIDEFLYDRVEAGDDLSKRTRKDRVGRAARGKESDPG